MNDESSFEQAVRTVRQASDDPGAADAETVVDALTLLKEEIATRPSGLSMRGPDGAPDWYEHEVAGWKLANWVRSYLRHEKRLRGRNKIMDVVAGYVADSRLGKGRQNFAMLLGDFAKGAYVEALVGQLEDEEVAAQIWSVLAKWRIAGFEEKARAHLDSADTRLRRNARKYLKRVSEQPDGTPTDAHPAPGPPTHADGQQLRLTRDDG